MLNYEVDPRLLNPYVPPGTSLDSFDGRTYVSLVAFRFCRTKLLGLFSVPFHADFDEVNLRFYVRREHDGEERRGVVFIAEVVPRRAIAATARLLYGENYKYFPMRHRVVPEGLSTTAEYQYEWQVGGQWCTISAQTAGPPARPQEGTLEQFITEHYWGYSGQGSSGCLEYHVSHIPWQVWVTRAARFEGEASTLYGKELADVLHQRPTSAFVADGSPFTLFRGCKIQ
jgi:uncharacterized protein